MFLIELPGDSSAPLVIGLRPMTGDDELSINSADGSAALALLGRLACDHNGVAIDLTPFTLSQIDRLLAGLYNLLYGNLAECRARCGKCEDDYEFTLALSELIATQDAAGPGPPEADGAWTLADTRRVRAPRLADIHAVTDSESLLARLVVSGDPSVDSNVVTDFLERAAPVLSLELDAACPHCGESETVRFDLARYLIRRLVGERPFLIRETHLIASRYGWSHSEIMGIARSDRRAYSGLIESERSPIP